MAMTLLPVGETEAHRVKEASETATIVLYLTR